MIESHFGFLIEKEVSNISNVPTHLDSIRKVMIKCKLMKLVFLNLYKCVD